MRRATAAAAALLALLALASLALPAEGRTLKKSQAERDAEALAEQQAQQEALVADQAEREAELLARQVQAQERKNREAGADGGSNSSSDTAAEQTKRRKDRRSSDGASDRASDASQGCTEPDYSGMSRKERRKAKKAYEKCCRDAERGQSDGASYDDGSQDETAASGRVKAKTSKRSTGGKGVRATYHYYSPAYETSSLYCADAFRGREASLLGRPWTAYCAESILGPMSADKCGRCIRVTNLATGDSVEATVVDMCGTGGMDLDPEAFNPIDSDGAGVRDGHMNVHVEWC